MYTSPDEGLQTMDNEQNKFLDVQISKLQLYTGM